MNQINIEEALKIWQPVCATNGFHRRRKEGNKQGATAYAIYLAVIDD